MSMLTPPGMGGKYRITGDKYPRMRRPRNRGRIVVVALAAVVALGLAGWGTLQLIDVFTGDDGKTASAARTKDCKSAPQPSAAPPLALKPGQITVNVYNATPRGGLAKAAADELKKRGFAIGKVGNAPEAYDKKVPGTAILLGGSEAQQGAFRVLATQLKSGRPQTDARRTADVDLILGTAFKTLDTKKDADAALATLARPAPAPSGAC
ncbi:LytR C-terminal domain-containing protein [Streptomyces sp. NBC_00879]|uniref:LytR C-terminal domain-containing protein n=1 Tax=unclassified Streptomyces TaxID=2593676 RepID=UPI00386E77E0|nr:LytR C-terminal domain-containing protein [Streptomyces sp. NBC_00885]WSY76018.1 LytR C-terminal domain-containing protein [Streptomyces sp. NBC_00879]